MQACLATVNLSQGCQCGQELLRTATVRALTGEDEIALDSLEDLSAAAKVTALLTRCMDRVGGIQPVGPELAASFTVGDREALVLHLRRLTLGDRVPCLIRCPECQEALDLDLRVSDLLVSPVQASPLEHEVSITSMGVSYRVRFRLPTGADQEEAARIARHAGAEAGARRILERCVAEVREDGRVLDALPTGLEQALSRAMAERDPQAELMLNPTCPACGANFSTLLDAASFFFEEIRAHVRSLFREVHLLARHYHWSESDILAMTPARRRTYLSLIAEEIEARAAR